MMRPIHWNADGETLPDGREKVSIYMGYRNFLTPDGWKPTEAAFAQVDGKFEVRNMPFLFVAPQFSDENALFEDNAMFDATRIQRINEPSLLCEMTADGAQHVQGHLESYENNGVMDMVVYENAYPSVGADLVYRIQRAKNPRVLKLIRFNQALQTDTDFTFSFNFNKAPKVHDKKRGCATESENTKTKLRAEGEKGLLFKNKNREIYFSDFHIWDSAPIETENDARIRRKVAKLKVTVEKKGSGYTLIKHVPAAFFDGAQFPVYTDTTVEFKPDNSVGKDVYIATGAGNQDTNHDVLDSDVQNLFLGDGSTGNSTAYRFLIKFTELSSIPSSAVVSDATIELYEFVDNVTADITVNRLLRNWVENEATWNVYSSGNSWTTAGAASDGNDIDADESETVASNGSAANAYIAYNNAVLTDDVQKMVDGTYPNNYGWRFAALSAEFTGSSPPTTNIGYRSAGGVSGSSSTDPKLTVVYLTSSISSSISSSPSTSISSSPSTSISSSISTSPSTSISSSISTSPSSSVSPSTSISSSISTSISSSISTSPSPSLSESRSSSISSSISSSVSPSTSISSSVSSSPSSSISTSISSSPSTSVSSSPSSSISSSISSSPSTSVSSSPSTSVSSSISSSRSTSISSSPSSSPSPSAPVGIILGRNNSTLVQTGIRLRRM